MPTKAWIARAVRDWRVKTMVPIVAIHLGAFAGLYVFTYEFAMREVASAFRVGATYVLEDSVALFSDKMDGHSATKVSEGLASVARAHKGTTIAVFSAKGELLSAAGRTLPFDPALVRAALSDPPAGTVRIRGKGEELLATGVQALRNEPACRHCHANDPLVLGAIGIQRDLGERVRGTAGRLRRAVGLVVLGWLVLLGATYLIRARVIGRPLAEIEKTVLSSAGEESLGPSHDLDSLAGRVHGAVWALIERQRERSHEIEKGMERVTQLAVLGDMAAGLSHEIKNPLAGIRAALGALRHDAAVTPAERAEVVEEMISEVDRVNRTVDSLLSLARPRSLLRTHTDLGRLVRKATALLDARARTSGVRMSIDVAPAVPTLELDSDLVIQVVVNLVGNALDAVKPGGSVRVGVEAFPERDGAALVVADDGEGIPAEVRARIFEPFFTTKRGGTGLGLPLCLRIVEQHGGTITVESEPGAGTTFVVLLPCREVPVRRGDARGVHPAG